MKALLLDEPGPVETLRVADVPVPEPGPGEIRVAAHAFDLNPADYQLAELGYDGWTYPFILGLDAAGTVDRVGEGVEQWKPGDRVFYHGDLRKPGAFAEYAITTAHTTAAIPDRVSFTAAAAVSCAGLTAYQCLVRRLAVQPGHSVWVQAGAGGVGGFGVQLCAHIGATVITTCSERNFEFVKGLGADHVIDYSREDVVARILEITGGRGVDRVQAGVDQNSANQGVETLAYGGGIACIAGLPALEEGTFERSISLHRIFLGGAHADNNREEQLDLARMADELIALVADEKIDPMIEQVIPLEEIPAALRQLQGRHVRGKIVATPS